MSVSIFKEHIFIIQPFINLVPESIEAIHSYSSFLPKDRASTISRTSMIFYTTSGSLPKYTRHTKNLAQEKIDCLDVWLFLPSGVICTVSDAEKDSRQEEKGMTKEWDGWMASPTRWTWVWASSRSWWWTRKPGVLQSTGLQRVGHDWVTQLTELRKQSPWIITSGPPDLKGRFHQPP